MGVWADMEAEIRNILLVAHRRWGKDEIGLNDCAIRAAKTPANYFYCLPEQEHARRSMWSAINKHTGKRRMDECFPEGFRIGNLKEQEMAIAFTETLLHDPVLGKIFDVQLALQGRAATAAEPPGTGGLDPEALARKLEDRTEFTLDLKGKR